MQNVSRMSACAPSRPTSSSAAGLVLREFRTSHQRSVDRRLWPKPEFGKTIGASGLWQAVRPGRFMSSRP